MVDSQSGFSISVHLGGSQEEQVLGQAVVVLEGVHVSGGDVGLALRVAVDQVHQGAGLQAVLLLQVVHLDKRLQHAPAEPELSEGQESHAKNEHARLTVLKLVMDTWIVGLTRGSKDCRMMAVSE